MWAKAALKFPTMTDFSSPFQDHHSGGARNRRCRDGAERDEGLQDARGKTVSRDNGWAVLLAGGDGTRLQTLTQKIAGDCRPKQFCQIYGGKSLLTQTRERIAPLFNSRRTLCVVTQAHEKYYREGHRDADNSEILIQPHNRGTAVAIGASLIRIARVEPDALVT